MASDLQFCWTSGPCSVVLLLFLVCLKLISRMKGHVEKKNMMRWKTREIILILLPTKAAWTRDEACDIHLLLQANVVNPSTTGTIKSSAWNSINFRQTTNQFGKTWVEIQPQPHPLLSPKPSCFGVPNFVSPVFFGLVLIIIAAWTLQFFQRSKHSSSKTRHRRAS